jgi:AraC family transcriptional regulator
MKKKGKTRETQSKSVEYPGFELLGSKIVSRSLDNQRNESIGFGFMRKDGVTVDEENFKFGKYALVYVIRGTGEYVDPSGNSHPLCPGSVFQRHPNVQHSTYLNPESGWRECFLDFGAGLYEALTAYRIIKPDKFVYNPQPDKAVEREIFNLMVRLENSVDSELPYIVSDTISFLSRLTKRCESVALDAMDVFIDESCAYFTRNPEKRFDLEKYCSKRGVGYENFRKRFRLKTGVSPGRYIINRRVDAACEMLRMSKTQIGQIALALGYDSPFEFSAQFKKVTGVSPKHYRR